MQPIVKQFARSTSEFIRNKCDSEHRAKRMSTVEFNRAVRINSLIDSYAARYNGKTAEIFRCKERMESYIEIQDLVVNQTQGWKILGPMHLTNPFDCTISVHRFMSGGGVTGTKLDTRRRYCNDHRDIEPNFVADDDFDESLGLTRADLAAMREGQDSTAVVSSANQKENETISEKSAPVHSSVRASPHNVTINAGNIVFPSNLSPISSSPIPQNPAKKRKIEILEELAEGMKTMTVNFSRLLEEVKEANRGHDDSFEVLSEN